MAARPKIGVALGSGGARGWAHIGVMRALAELGVVPDVIAGSSMGALVGAAVAGDKVDGLEEWARGQTRRSFLTLLDVRLTGGGLVRGAEIGAVLGDLGLPARIEDLARPFIAVATDLETGKEVWLRDGDCMAAVRASVALPGVISPAHIDGRWLIDGGVVNPIPVSAARDLGAGVIIAVNPNARLQGAFWQAPTAEGGWAEILPDLPEAVRALWPTGPRDAPAPSYVDLISSTIDIMTDRIRRLRLAEDAPQVLVNIDLSSLSVLEFHRAGEAIDAGYVATMAQAKTILACVG